MCEEFGSGDKNTICTTNVEVQATRENKNTIYMYNEREVRMHKGKQESDAPLPSLWLLQIEARFVLVCLPVHVITKARILGIQKPLK